MTACIMDAPYLINILYNNEDKVFSDNVEFDEIIILPSTIDIIKELIDKNILSQQEFDEIYTIINISNSISIPEITDDIWKIAAHINIQTSIDNKLILAHIKKLNVTPLILNKELKEILKNEENY